MAPQKHLDAGAQFMARTRYAHLTPSDQSKGEAPPDVAWTFGDAPRHPLPAPYALDLPPLDLADLITRRTSLRRYVETPLTLEELSCLLWCTQGVKQAQAHHTMRTVPSAGARHPLETCLLANRVAGLDPGLYGYAALDHELALLQQGDDLPERLAAACHGQQFVRHAAATFFWVAVPERTTWRYAERGYRYLHLDVGHVCQDLYLVAEAIGAGACAIAAFDDDALIDVLQLDANQAFAIYVATVGKRPAGSAGGRQ